MDPGEDIRKPWVVDIQGNTDTYVEAGTCEVEDNPPCEEASRRVEDLLRIPVVEVDILVVCCRPWVEANRNVAVEDNMHGVDIQADLEEVGRFLVHLRLHRRELRHLGLVPPRILPSCGGNLLGLLRRHSF